MHRLGQGGILLSLGLALVSAAALPIGVAVSTGKTLLLNNASYPGNATVLEGSTLGANKDGAVNVRLNNGSHIRFATSSSGKLYLDHVDLLTGTAQITGYAAKANGLRVSADGNSSAAVSLRGKKVEVVAMSGDVHVFNAQGVSVANMLPGRVMSFFPEPQQAGASAPSILQGCAVKNGNNLRLTDETSNTTVELRGGNVKAGRHVQVSGTAVPNATLPAGVSQVVNVTSVKDLGPCPAGAAGAAGSQGAASGSSGGGSRLGLYIGAATVAGAGIVAGVIATSGSNNSSAAAGSSASSVPPPVTVGGGTTGTGTASGGAGSATYTVMNSQGYTFTITITPSTTAGAAPTVTVVQAGGPTVLPSSTLTSIATAVQTSVQTNQTSITSNPSSATTVIDTAVGSSSGAPVTTPATCVSPCATV